MGSRRDDPGCGMSMIMQANFKKLVKVMFTRDIQHLRESAQSSIGHMELFGPSSRSIRSHIANFMMKDTHQWGIKKIQRKTIIYTTNKQRLTSKLKMQTAKLRESAERNDQ